MPDHALELTFESSSMAGVGAQWEAPKAAGLPSQADHRSMTNAPHFTLVAAVGIEERADGTRDGRATAARPGNVSYVQVRTECDPPVADDVDPDFGMNCLATSFEVEGSETADTSTYLQHGVPMYDGFFRVDVSGNLQNGYRLSTSNL